MNYNNDITKWQKIIAQIFLKIGSKLLTILFVIQVTAAINIFTSLIFIEKKFTFHKNVGFALLIFFLLYSSFLTNNLEIEVKNTEKLVDDSVMDGKKLTLEKKIEELKKQYHIKSVLIGIPFATIFFYLIYSIMIFYFLYNY